MGALVPRHEPGPAGRGDAQTEPLRELIPDEQLLGRGVFAGW